MHMRRVPKVTLKPGEGIHVVKCSCMLKEGKRACVDCICTKEGEKKGAPHCVVVAVSAGMLALAMEPARCPSEAGRGMGGTIYCES